MNNISFISILFLNSFFVIYAQHVAVDNYNVVRIKRESDTTLSTNRFIYVYLKLRIAIIKLLHNKAYAYN